MPAGWATPSNERSIPWRRRSHQLQQQEQRGQEEGGEGKEVEHTVGAQDQGVGPLGEFVQDRGHHEAVEFGQGVFGVTLSQASGFLVRPLEEFFDFFLAKLFLPSHARKML